MMMPAQAQAQAQAQALAQMRAQAPIAQRVHAFALSLPAFQRLVLGNDTSTGTSNGDGAIPAVHAEVIRGEVIAPVPHAVPSPDSIADEIAKLKSLRDAGVLTEDEFVQANQRALCWAQPA